MKNTTHAMSSLAVILVAAAIGCGNQQGIPSVRTQADSSLIPDSEVTGARIYLYDGGIRTAEILATRIVKFERIDSMMAYALDIDALDSLGLVSSELTGDSGVIREQSGYVDVYGHVVLVSSSGRRLETDFLHWESKTDLLTADTTHRVKLIQGGDIVTGWGLEADLRTDRYRILKDVEGEITNPDKIAPN